MGRGSDKNCVKGQKSSSEDVCCWWRLVPSSPHWEINLQKTCNEDVWSTLSDSNAAFSRQRCVVHTISIEINQIDYFMKTMTKLARLETTQKNFTNHGVQNTLVWKLQKSGILTNKIDSITGHSSEQSLREYADTDRADSLQSHPSQPPQQKQYVNTLALPDPVSYLSYLQPSYPVPFSHCYSSYPSCIPTPQHVFNCCNFYFGSSTNTCTQLYATNAIHMKCYHVFIESDDSVIVLVLLKML